MFNKYFDVFNLDRLNVVRLKGFCNEPHNRILNQGAFQYRNLQGLLQCHI